MELALIMNVCDNDYYARFIVLFFERIFPFLGGNILFV